MPSNQNNAFNIRNPPGISRGNAEPTRKNSIGRREHHHQSSLGMTSMERIREEGQDERDNREGENRRNNDVIVIEDSDDSDIEYLGTEKRREPSPKKSSSSHGRDSVVGRNWNPVLSSDLFRTSYSQDKSKERPRVSDIAENRSCMFTKNSFNLKQWPNDTSETGLGGNSRGSGSGSNDVSEKQTERNLNRDERTARFSFNASRSTLNGDKSMEEVPKSVEATRSSSTIAFSFREAIQKISTGNSNSSGALAKSSVPNQEPKGKREKSSERMPEPMEKSGGTETRYSFPKSDENKRTEMHLNPDERSGTMAFNGSRSTSNGDKRMEEVPKSVDTNRSSVSTESRSSADIQKNSTGNSNSFGALAKSSRLNQEPKRKSEEPSERMSKPSGETEVHDQALTSEANERTELHLNRDELSDGDKSIEEVPTSVDTNRSSVSTESRSSADIQKNSRGNSNSFGALVESSRLSQEPKGRKEQSSEQMSKPIGYSGGSETHDSDSSEANRKSQKPDEKNQRQLFLSILEADIIKEKNRIKEMEKASKTMKPSESTVVSASEVDQKKERDSKSKRTPPTATLDLTGTNENYRKMKKMKENEAIDQAMREDKERARLRELEREYYKKLREKEDAENRDAQLVENQPESETSDVSEQPMDGGERTQEQLGLKTKGSVIEPTKEIIEPTKTRLLLKVPKRVWDKVAEASKPDHADIVSPTLEVPDAALRIEMDKEREKLLETPFLKRPRSQCLEKEFDLSKSRKDIEVREEMKKEYEKRARMMSEEISLLRDLQRKHEHSPEL